MKPKVGHIKQMLNLHNTNSHLLSIQAELQNNHPTDMKLSGNTFTHYPAQGFVLKFLATEQKSDAELVMRQSYRPKHRISTSCWTVNKALSILEAINIID